MFFFLRGYVGVWVGRCLPSTFSSSMEYLLVSSFVSARWVLHSYYSWLVGEREGDMGAILPFRFRLSVSLKVVTRIILCITLAIVQLPP